MQSFIEIMLKFTVSFDCRNENLIAMFQPGCAGLHQDNENLVYILHRLSILWLVTENRKFGATSLSFSRVYTYLGQGMS